MTVIIRPALGVPWKLVDRGTRPMLRCFGENITLLRSSTLVGKVKRTCFRGRG